MDVRWLDQDEWSNACGGTCDLFGPQHFRDDCIYHSPRNTKNARRLRKVQDGETFHEKVAICIRLLYRFGGDDVRLVLEDQDVDGYVTGTYDIFEKCFGVTEVYSRCDGRLIGRAQDL